MMRIEISGVHAPVDDRLKRYIRRKIGGLDRYVPWRSRKSTWAEVRLNETGAKDKNKCDCRVIIHLPIEPVTVHETTVNMYAAVDIAEEKLKHGLRKYKDMHSPAKLHHRLMRRLRGGGV
jgi:ribosomal subunit interface protein